MLSDESALCRSQQTMLLCGHESSRGLFASTSLSTQVTGRMPQVQSAPEDLWHIMLSYEPLAVALPHNSAGQTASYSMQPCSMHLILDPGHQMSVSSAVTQAQEALQGALERDTYLSVPVRVEVHQRSTWSVYRCKQDLTAC